MGTILFTWELGAGLGHMMQIFALANELHRRGHRVFAALRDLPRACSIFADQSGITLLPTPAKMTPAEPIRPACMLAHILHNVGHANPLELAGMTAAWRGLFDVVRPDLIVFDHSPTALLAARGIETRRVTLGAGFFCPPDEHPLPNLRRGQAGHASDPQRLLADESVLLERMNRLLESRRQPALDRISQLYADVDDCFLVTFRELDHYPNRALTTRYRGVCNGAAGKRPAWPAGTGRKVYAYLKNFPVLPKLLEHLTERGLPTLVFVDGIPRAIQEQFAGSTLTFSNERLDIRKVAEECDMAILNANHATAAALLLAGKPLLQLPLSLEQELFAEAVVRIGGGVIASAANPDDIVQKLNQLLSSGSYAGAAARFAAHHANFDPVRENEQMVTRLEALIE